MGNQTQTKVLICSFGFVRNSIFYCTECLVYRCINLCSISRLLVKIRRFFRDRIIFCETKDAANKIFITLLVFEIQFQIKILLFPGTTRISFT